MRLRLFCFIFMSFAWLNLSQAIVDVKNGNFTTSRIDLDVPAVGFDLRVHRTYNSEPIFFGIFGAGWCSDFETKLIVLSESDILVRQCGNGRDHFFKAATPSQLAATLDILRDRLNIEFPKEKAKIDGLLTAAKTNLPLLATFIEAYKISMKPAKEAVFLSQSGSGDVIRFDDNNFSLKFPDNRVQKFDSLGRISFQADGFNNSLTYVRGVAGAVTEVRHSSGSKLTLKYNSDGRVAKVIAPNEMFATYQYDKTGDLVSVSGKSDSETYEYDLAHQLAKIGKDFRIEYDKDGRNVTSIVRGGCREDFSYEQHEHSHKVKTVLKCNGSASRVADYDIQIADGVGQPRVQKVSTLINGKAADKFEYNDYGLPLFVRTSQGESRYRYNAGQRLESVSLGDQLLRFRYSPDGMARSVEGKEFTISYKYNSLNRISEYSTGSDTVKLKYDFLGRLTQIGRNKAKPYELEYSAQSAQPRLISLAGKGRVSLLARDYRSLASDKEWIGLDSAANLLTDYQALQQPLRLISLSSVSR